MADFVLIVNASRIPPRSLQASVQRVHKEVALSPRQSSLRTSVGRKIHLLQMDRAFKRDNYSMLGYAPLWRQMVEGTFITFSFPSTKHISMMCLTTKWLRTHSLPFYMYGTCGRAISLAREWAPTEGTPEASCPQRRADLQ